MQAIVSLRLTRGPLSEDIVGQYVLSVQVGSHHFVHDFERFMIYIYIVHIKMQYCPSLQWCLSPTLTTTNTEVMVLCQGVAGLGKRSWNQANISS